MRSKRGKGIEQEGGDTEASMEKNYIASEVKPGRRRAGIVVRTTQGYCPIASGEERTAMWLTWKPRMFPSIENKKIPSRPIALE